MLVVDDNTINLKVTLHKTTHSPFHKITVIQIMATFMRKIGCNYETASNGLIALEKYMASEKPYDYVLMGTFPYHLLPFLNYLLILTGS